MLFFKFVFKKSCHKLNSSKMHSDWAPMTLDNMLMEGALMEGTSLLHIAHI